METANEDFNHSLSSGDRDRARMLLRYGAGLGRGGGGGGGGLHVACGGGVGSWWGSSAEEGASDTRLLFLGLPYLRAVPYSTVPYCTIPYRTIPQCCVVP